MADEPKEIARRRWTDINTKEMLLLGTAATATSIGIGTAAYLAVGGSPSLSTVLMLGAFSMAVVVPCLAVSAARDTGRAIRQIARRRTIRTRQKDLQAGILSTVPDEDVGQLSPTSEGGELSESSTDQ